LIAHDGRISRRGINPTTLDQPQSPLALTPCQLALPCGFLGNRAHTFNGMEDRCLIHTGTSLFAQTLARELMFPERDRRSAQIPIAKIVVLSIRSEQVDATQVTRIVADDHLLWPAHPYRERVRPVKNRV